LENGSSSWLLWKNSSRLSLRRASFTTYVSKLSRNGSRIGKHISNATPSQMRRDFFLGSETCGEGLRSCRSISESPIVTSRVNNAGVHTTTAAALVHRTIELEASTKAKNEERDAEARVAEKI
jgi:hypothetical protein